MAEKKVTAKELAAEKGAKQPEDKKAASTVKAQADGATIVAEVGGREWTISQDALDDFELLDDLAELENGNAVRLPSALTRLLGAIAARYCSAPSRRFTAHRRRRALPCSSSARSTRSSKSYRHAWAILHPP